VAVLLTFSGCSKAIAKYPSTKMDIIRVVIMFSYKVKQKVAFFFTGAKCSVFRQKQMIYKKVTGNKSQFLTCVGSMLIAG
jgi:hypothetical protein